MTWIPKPLSVGDGKIGAEVEPEVEADLASQRTAPVAPSLQMIRSASRPTRP